MSWTKSIKNALLGAPAKKGKKAIKPAHAKSLEEKRVRLVDLAKTPPTRRLLGAVVVALLGVALWVVPSVVPVAAVGAGRVERLTGALRGAQLPEGGSWRSSLKSGSLPDDLATLYASLALHTPLPPPAAAAARSRLASRETLWEAAAACALLLSGPQPAPGDADACRERLLSFIQTPTQLLADPGREPQLRTVLLATQVLVRLGVTLPTELATWARSLQADDGGFGPQAGLPSSVMDTWRAIRLFRLLDALDPEVAQDAARFVRSCQAVDGGFSQRPQSLLERAQRHADSPLLPSIRGTHALVLLGEDAGAGLRFLLSRDVPTTSSAAHMLWLLEDAPTSLAMAVATPWLAAWCRSASLLLMLLVAPMVYWNLSPPGEMSVLAACCVLAGVLYELGWGAPAAAATAVALLLALHMTAVQIPFNDTGEEMLYVSLASVAGSFGLFYALSYSGGEVFTSSVSLYVFLIWSPLCTYLAVYVACMFMVRPNTYYVASAYGAWLITVALLPFLLYRRDMLDTVIRLLLIRGHFAPALATSAGIALFWNHAAALVANSV